MTMARLGSPGAFLFLAGFRLGHAPLSRVLSDVTTADHPLTDFDARIRSCACSARRANCAWPPRPIRRPCRREVVDADALIVRTGGDIDAALMDCGAKLKVVGRHGVGYDQIDIPAATERGIQVVYTPGANTQSVCEHVFAMMIGLSKHFPADDGCPRGGRLPRPDQVTGRDLLGARSGSSASAGSAGASAKWRRPRSG